MIGGHVTDDLARPGPSVSTGRRVARAGAAGVVVATASVAVLQVLQQTIGAFDPRPVVSVLIVVAVFFAGLAAERLRARRRQRDAVASRDAELRRILGVWPPERMSEAEPLRLGVFPARRELDQDAPYVPRGIDGDLCAALADGADVLVTGPARAGKSRTALEAARAALPHARVLAPRGPHALADLLALDPPIDLGDHIATIVWLDGVERYAGVLDAVTLEQLTDLTRGSTVVLTVRDEDWASLLGQSGSGGDTARAAVAQTRAFALPGRLGEQELAEAGRLYPGIDMAAGIGAALASRGTDSGPPVPRAAPPGDDRDPVPSGRRDPQLVLPLAGALGAVAAFALVWALAGFSTPPPPTIGEQLGAAKRDGSKGGRFVYWSAVADLHGTGESSYVLDFQDAKDATEPQSDQLRVYDVRGDRLVERLRFQPGGERRAVFSPRSTGDVDGDGQHEVVGGYGFPDDSGARQALVPFAINWDDEAQRYVLVSLDLGTPALSSPAAIVAERQYRAVYGQTVRLEDPERKLQIAAHRVQDFMVTEDARRLIAAYFLRPPLGGRQGLVELHPMTLDQTTGRPLARPCSLPDPAPIVAPFDDRRKALTSVLRERWATVSKGRTCG